MKKLNLKNKKGAYAYAVAIIVLFIVVVAIAYFLPPVKEFILALFGKD